MTDALFARVQDSFDKQGLMRHLGATLHEVREGYVAIRMGYRPELTQQHGYFHAGGLSSIADSAGGYAGLTCFTDGMNVLTVEFKINLINPAKGDYLEATGQVVKSGRTLTVCQLEVFAVTEGTRTLVAIGQQTLIAVADRT